MNTAEILNRYKDDIRSTFHDFLNHELIAKDPYSLSEEEIWDGIKARSNNRTEHRCDLINRMNCSCTLATIIGHKTIPTNYNAAENGIFAYTYNEESEFNILYSTFLYPHVFSDEGMLHSSFGGSGKSIRLTVEDYRDGKRQKYCIDPSSLFENPANIGTSIFLEFSILGTNKFGSIKSIPSFVNIDGSESYFINEIQYSLLKTKILLVSLIDKYPSHLMHMPGNFNRFHKELSECFRSLYNDEMKSKISLLKESVSDEQSRHNIHIDLPF